MAVDERWYAARRVQLGPRGRSRTERLSAQPSGGFPNVTGVMTWLEQHGHIAREETPEGTWFRGWGDPYCAVAGSRGDPWESEQGQVKLDG